MDELIQRYLQGAASEDDRLRLDEWRRAAPANEQRLRSIRLVWEATDARYLGRWAAMPPSAGALIERAARPDISPVRSPVRWRAWATAAILVLAIGAGWLRMRQALGTGDTLAAGDAALTATLADGSFVLLAPGSRIEFRATEARRAAHLRGTAFFAVAERGDQPFTVDAGSTRITVLGTRFEVRERRDSVHVAVVEGLVSFASRAGAVQLARGEVGEVTGGGGTAIPVRRVTADIYAELDSVGAPLLYQRTPLAQVADELARRFGRPIAITDSALAGRLVTARFGDERFEDAMAAVCAIARARCRLDVTPVRVEP
jgi:transmembrane sensor